VEITCGNIILTLYMTYRAFKWPQRTGPGAFVGCRFKRIWCVIRIKVKGILGEAKKVKVNPMNCCQPKIRKEKLRCTRQPNESK